MSVVLIVEDEPTLRSSMARGLAKLPDVDIVQAGTLASALASIASQKPNVVVSDLNLPDGSGVELLSALDQSGVSAPVIFISAHLSSFRSRIPDKPTIIVREKPVPLNDLRELVQEQLANDTSDAPPFSVDEFVQLACLGKHSLLIELVDGERKHGQIVIRAGEVWSAEDPQGTGEEAFHRLAFQKHLRVVCQTSRDDRRPRNINRPWMNLLLNAAQALDEAKRDFDAAPSDDFQVDFEESDGGESLVEDADEPAARTAVGAHPAAGGLLNGPSGKPGDFESETDEINTEDLPEISALAPGLNPVIARAMAPSEPPGIVDVLSAHTTKLSTPPNGVNGVHSESFPQLWARALEAVLARDYVAALRHLTAASAQRPDDPLVRANLRRLRELGYQE